MFVITKEPSPMTVREVFEPNPTHPADLRLKKAKDEFESLRGDIDNLLALCDKLE